MKKLGLGLCLSAVMALTSMAWAAEKPQKEGNAARFIRRDARLV